MAGGRVPGHRPGGQRNPHSAARRSSPTPPELRGRAFGFHRGADHLGAVIGSLAAWYFLSRGVEVRRVIEWSVVPGVVAFLLLTAVLRGTQMPAVAPARPAAADPIDAGSRVFWPPVLALTALTFCRVPETLLLLRLQDAGLAVALVPLVWAGLHVVRSASSYPGGWPSDPPGPPWRPAGWCSPAWSAPSAPQTVRGRSHLPGAGPRRRPHGIRRRAMVARLSPVRTGRGFGLYHALTGAAALPAGLFGWLYQSVSGPPPWVERGRYGGGGGPWLGASTRIRERQPA